MNEDQIVTLITNLSRLEGKVESLANQVAGIRTEIDYMRRDKGGGTTPQSIHTIYITIGIAIVIAAVLIANSFR